MSNDDEAVLRKAEQFVNTFRRVREAIQAGQVSFRTGLKQTEKDFQTLFRQVQSLGPRHIRRLAQKGSSDAHVVLDTMGEILYDGSRTVQTHHVVRFTRDITKWIYHLHDSTRTHLSIQEDKAEETPSPDFHWKDLLDVFHLASLTSYTLSVGLLCFVSFMMAYLDPMAFAQYILFQGSSTLSHLIKSVVNSRNKELLAQYILWYAPLTSGVTWFLWAHWKKLFASTRKSAKDILTRINKELFPLLLSLLCAVFVLYTVLAARFYPTGVMENLYRMNQATSQTMWNYFVPSATMLLGRLSSSSPPPGGIGER